MNEVWGREFYRYVSRKELEVIESTGMLRGGIGAGRQRTYWTTDFYEDAGEAQARLALRAPPEVRIRFRIANDPRVGAGGERVEPDEGQPGGGTEWWSRDAVEVDLPLLEKEVL